MSYQYKKSYCEDHIDGLVQERRNSSALTMELRLSCTNPSIWWFCLHNGVPILAKQHLYISILWPSNVIWHHTTWYTLVQVMKAPSHYLTQCWLTHWGRVTHICVSKQTGIGSDNGLSPGRRQAIIWNNAGILLIGPLGTNFNEFLVESLIFSFKKMRLKVSSAKRRPFCLGLNELITSEDLWHPPKGNFIRIHINPFILTCFENVYIYLFTVYPISPQ